MVTTPDSREGPGAQNPAYGRLTVNRLIDGASIQSTTVATAATAGKPSKRGATSDSTT